MCMCMHVSTVATETREASDPPNMWVRGLNLGPLEEQDVPVTAASSLQPPILHLFRMLTCSHSVYVQTSYQVTLKIILWRFYGRQIQLISKLFQS